jgi:hypothetical protein
MNNYRGMLRLESLEIEGSASELDPVDPDERRGFCAASGCSHIQRSVRQALLGTLG